VKNDKTDYRFSITEQTRLITAKLEHQFEVRFENLARDPKLLALVANSLNYVANNKIQICRFETEVASLKARAAQLFPKFLKKVRAL
jgi:hypothetical protein